MHWCRWITSTDVCTGFPTPCSIMSESNYCLLLFLSANEVPQPRNRQSACRSVFPLGLTIQPSTELLGMCLRHLHTLYPHLRHNQRTPSYRFVFGVGTEKIRGFFSENSYMSHHFSIDKISNKWSGGLPSYFSVASILYDKYFWSIHLQSLRKHCDTVMDGSAVKFAQSSLLPGFGSRSN